MYQAKEFLNFAEPVMNQINTNHSGVAKISFHIISSMIKTPAEKKLWTNS
jgi:hypothetical protein